MSDVGVLSYSYVPIPFISIDWPVTLPRTCNLLSGSGVPPNLSVLKLPIPIFVPSVYSNVLNEILLP